MARAYAGRSIEGAVMSVPDTFSQPKTKPGVATAEAGFVILEGPDDIAVTMTADAATNTAHSLLSAAGVARTQDLAGDASV